MVEKTPYIYSICIIFVVAVVALAMMYQSGDNGITGKLSWVNTKAHLTTNNPLPTQTNGVPTICAEKAYKVAERAVTWGAIRGVNPENVVEGCKQKQEGQYGDGEKFSSYNEGKFCSIITKKFDQCMSESTFTNKDPRRNLKERRS